jgi:hypothetical protein
MAARTLVHIYVAAAPSSSFVNPCVCNRFLYRLPCRQSRESQSAYETVVLLAVWMILG